MAREPAQYPFATRQSLPASMTQASKIVGKRKGRKHLIVRATGEIHIGSSDVDTSTPGKGFTWPSGAILVLDEYEGELYAINAGAAAVTVSVFEVA